MKNVKSRIKARCRKVERLANRPEKNPHSGLWKSFIARMPSPKFTHTIHHPY
jgi:hypothetical protein